MLSRHVRRTLVAFAALMMGAAAVLTGVLASPAGAAALTSSDGLTTVSTQATVATQTPFSSGQVVSVQVAANSTFNTANMVLAGYPSGADPIKLVECADPNGLASNLPTRPSQCESQTIDSNVTAAADGSINLTGANGYSVLALPDPTLGSSAITCGVAPNACVIGIFANQNDFTKPHLFSAPFQVSSNGGLDDGSNPGDGTSSANGPPTITSAGAATFSAGVNGSFQVTASGFPGSTFSETGPLPTGVSLSPSGQLSGTPSQPGTSWPITITATNGTAPDATQSFTLSVVTTLTSADGLTGISTQGPITSGTPYSSGQTISVQVAANSTFNTANMVLAGYPSGADPIKLVECADPNGLVSGLPTNPSECESQTIDSNVTAGANGSINLTGANGYSVLALPDPTLGTSPITCGVAPNACVIGIFANQNDFTKPHLFSAPFQVSSNGGLDDGSNPGDGTSSANGAPSITSAAATTFTQNSYGSFHLVATGFPGSVFTESGTLPAGVTLSPGGLLSGTPSQSGVFPVTVVASNGTLPESLQSFTLTVTGVPGAPTGAAATAGAASATVAFTAPGYNGGFTISGYTVTATDHTNSAHGGQTHSGSASPITVSGLTPGDNYTFTVTASNSFGTSPASAPSSSVTLPTVPGAPTIGTVAAGNASVQLNWTAPAATGGSPITGYVITPSSGAPVTVGNVASATVTGLTNGVVYRFTVAAVNVVGTGPASGPSATATPVGAGLTIVRSTLPSVADGGSYSQPLTVLGATGAVKWTVTGGALPGKIKLGKTGTLAGVVKSGKHPTAPGTYTFTVTATQKGKKGAPTLTASAPFSIVVTAH